MARDGVSAAGAGDRRPWSIPGGWQRWPPLAPSRGRTFHLLEPRLEGSKRDILEEKAAQRHAELPMVNEDRSMAGASHRLHAKGPVSANDVSAVVVVIF